MGGRSPEQLMDMLPQLVWTCRPDGSADYLSRRWAEYTGVGGESGLSMGWLESVMHPDDRARTYACFLGACAGKHEYAVEYRLRRSDGEYRWFMTRGTPVRDASGEIVCWIGTCTEIHERKMVEADLQEALRTRDEFISVASHELKTPLTALLLQNDLLQRRLARGTVPSLEQLSHAAAQNSLQLARLTALIDDMLDATRIRAGRMQLSRAEVRLDEVARGAASEVAPLYLAAGAPAPILGRVEALHGSWDARRLEQATTHLLRNALQYGRRRPVQIDVFGEGDMALLAVRDEGIGIPPAHLETIFGRFDRGFSAADACGLGLGLFIGRAIARAHGGDILVASELDVGSTFTLRLPGSAAAA